MTETPDDVKALAERQAFRSRLMGLSAITGGCSDNLAIALCSYFESRLDCPEEDEPGAWKVWATAHTESMIDRIIDLFDADRSAREERIRQEAAGAERDRLFTLFEKDPKQFAATVAGDAADAYAFRCAARQPETKAIWRSVANMTDAELAEEMTKSAKEFDQRGEHGGSPGESAYERMCEIETEQKRRARQPEPQRQEGGV